MREKWSCAIFSVLFGIGALSAVPLDAATSASAALRPAVRLSGNGWKFMFAPPVAEDQIVQIGFSDEDWETVAVPHSFNAQDGQSIQRTMKRGAGYYRLSFERPPRVAGQRYWLEFGAVSLVSDVWLNGRHLGRHEGGFSAFRVDATEALSPHGKNVLVVKADNSEQKPGSATQDVPPYSGDFNLQGGVYRDVKLFATSNTYVDTLDFGGPASTRRRPRPPRVLLKSTSGCGSGLPRNPISRSRSGSRSATAQTRSWPARMQR